MPQQEHLTAQKSGTKLVHQNTNRKKIKKQWERCYLHAEGSTDYSNFPGTVRVRGRKRPYNTTSSNWTGSVCCCICLVWREKASRAASFSRQASSYWSCASRACWVFPSMKFCARLPSFRRSNWSSVTDSCLLLIMACAYRWSRRAPPHTQQTISISGIYLPGFQGHVLVEFYWFEGSLEKQVLAL